ncbi:MAG: peroxiredoxin-like family protein [Dehalococcoidia bacterium]
MIDDVGSLAPDFELADESGARWRLSAHRGQPCVLMFHRHLACLPCQEHLLALRDHVERFGDATIAVVTFSDVERLAAYRSALALPFAVLSDSDRSVYRRYGLERGSWWRIYGVRTLREYARLLRAGRRPTRPTEDTLQLGGDFVIDPDGVIVFAARPASPATRPSVEVLIDAVEACR